MSGFIFGGQYDFRIQNKFQCDCKLIESLIPRHYNTLLVSHGTPPFDHQKNQTAP